MPSPAPASAWCVLLFALGPVGPSHAGPIVPESGVALAAPRSSVPAEAPDPLDDQYWWNGFALPEVDGWISCAVEYQGAIVVGGRFTQVGGSTAKNIAMWDATGWSALGEGVDGDVTSLAVYRGELIASGYFDRAGGVALRGIARWDGHRWASLGGGLWASNRQPSVGAEALAAGADFLYAAGEFDHAGDIATRYLTRWDGSEWSGVGIVGVDDVAQSLLISGDSLYVGGRFQTAGGVSARGVALWDGQAWHGLGRGVGKAYSGPPRVDAMAVHRGALVVAGVFDSAGTGLANGLARWDGNGWVGLGDPSWAGDFTDYRALSVRGDTLLVGGNFLREWDGSHWSQILPMIGTILCLLDTPTGFVVGGSFRAYTPQGDIGANQLGIRSGGHWEDPWSWTKRFRGLGGMALASVYASCWYGGDLVVSGNFDHTGGTTGRLGLGSIARWNGSSWGSLGTPPGGWTSSFLLEGDTLYASGGFLSAAGASPVARFDGQNWRTLDTLSMYGSALASFRGALYLGGRRLSLGDPRIAGVYRWDGTRWATVGLADDPGDFPSVASLIVHDDLLVVGGGFQSIAGVPASGVAAWDGLSWRAMDAGIASGNILALESCDGVLYAAGAMRDEDANFLTIMRWNGTRWEPVLDSNPHAYVRALECANHELFAGGDLDDFTYTTRGVLRMDSRGWHWLGSGVNGSVTSLVFHDGALYAGGSFSQAGGRSSWGIARWDLSSRERASAILEAGANVPNPFHGSTSLAYRLDAPGPVRVAVFDVRGRRMKLLEDGMQAAGTHVVTWDGRTEELRSAPPGVYFIRMELPGRTESRRVVRLR